METARESMVPGTEGRGAEKLTGRAREDVKGSGDLRVHYDDACMSLCICPNP